MSASDTTPVKSRSVAQPGNKIYVTKDKHTFPIDIQVAGEVIYGQWSASDGIVEFAVPDHLVSGFEKHYHFVVGNIVAAEAK